MADRAALMAEINVLLQQWCVNRDFYWRWEDYDAELVARALGTLFRGFKWRERIGACADMGGGLSAMRERQQILMDAAQTIGELLGMSAGGDKITVHKAEG